jgi:hypothetical protein
VEAGRVAVIEVFGTANTHLRFQLGTSKLTAYYPLMVIYSRVISDAELVDQMRMGMMT